MENLRATPIVMGAATGLFALLQGTIQHHDRFTRDLLSEDSGRRFSVLALQDRPRLLLSGLAVLFSVA